jgi:hypothetical protein
VASNTALEFYTSGETGSLVQRVVQNQGSAFYDVAPRSSNKLRVETPYLVAVIKGTEFDVTIAEETTSVSLFEGQLQIEALDIAATVQLEAGQIARRHKNDPHITVLDMEDGVPVAQTEARAGTQTSGERDSDPKAGRGVDAIATATTRNAGGAADLDAVVGVTAGGVDLGAEANVGLPAGTVSAELNVEAELLATPVDVGIEIDTDLGATELEVDLAVEDTTLDVDVDAGAVELELDLGIDPVPVVETEISVDGIVDLVPDPRDLLGL